MRSQTHSDTGDDMLSTIVVAISPRSTGPITHQTPRSPPPRLLSIASTNRIRTPSLSGSISDASSIRNLSPVSPSPGSSDGWNGQFHMFPKGYTYEASFTTPTPFGSIRREQEPPWGVGEDTSSGVIFIDPLEPPAFSEVTATSSSSSKLWGGDAMPPVDLLLDAAERIQAATVLLGWAMK